MLETVPGSGRLRLEFRPSFFQAALLALGAISESARPDPVLSGQWAATSGPSALASNLSWGQVRWLRSAPQTRPRRSVSFPEARIWASIASLRMLDPVAGLCVFTTNNFLSSSRATPCRLWQRFWARPSPPLLNDSARSFGATRNAIGTWATWSGARNSRDQSRGCTTVATATVAPSGASMMVWLSTSAVHLGNNPSGHGSGA